MKLTNVQQELLDQMTDGIRLWSFPNGFELNGRPFWPRQKNTVRRLIKLGLIYFDGRENSVQRECGLFSLGLVADKRREK